MGDLKKRKFKSDILVHTDDEKTILIEETKKLTDEQMIERLREYMRRVYELRLQNKENKNNDEE